MLQRTDTPDPPETFATRLDAWDYLRHLLGLLVSVFGAPSKLAWFGGVSLQYRADINAWLRPIERLARLLLLAEAAEIAPARPRRTFKRRAYIFPCADLSDKDSQKWRVCFPVLRANRKAGSGSKGYSIPTFNAASLAARVEAVVRVVLDPAPYARRLARRLDRRPSPRGVRALLAEVSTEGAPLMRIIDMARPLLIAVRFRFSSA